MAQIEPMDIDSEFDNKENSLHHSNVLPRTPCTEKGYEELDASELNMKLRYSITPASSPMSKSLTLNSLDKTFDSEDYINNVNINENCNLTRSLNSSIKRNDMTKLPKSLPLQVLSTESVNDSKNISVLRTLDKASEVHDNNASITLTGQNYLDDNMSLPSTSSSIAQTPEATTPTKEIPKHDGSSPIMRGLKSVLNMFRSSQSPIPPADVNVTPKQEIHSSDSVLIEEISKSHLGMASTPISNKHREISTSQRNSPHKESIVFNDDLERELQWKDETTILFKEEKIPIHKLLLPQPLSIPKKGETFTQSSDADKQKLNSTVTHMDISYSDSFSDVKTGRHIQSANITHTNDSLLAESDSEFVDCETTINNDDISDNKIMENFTSSINSQNITLKQSQNESQIHIEQPIANNKSETHLRTKDDKIEILAASKEGCNDHEIFLDSVIKTDDMKSNMVGVLLAENRNETGNELIFENISEFSEAENTAMGTILCDNLPKCLVDAKHPSDIPLPDEDDIENVLNFDPVTITTKQQEIKLKADQMDISIDQNETSMIDKNCLSENKKTKQLDLDSKGNNDITVKEIDQEKNNPDIQNTPYTTTNENMQTIESNDNRTLQIENAPLEEINSINLDNGEINLETSSELKMHYLEPNNEKYTGAAFFEDETKCDLKINQIENNISVQDNQSASVEHLNEIVRNKNTNMQNMESLIQQHENTYIFEEKIYENTENYLRSNNTFCSINNDVKECSANQFESTRDNKQVCISVTEDTTMAPENIAVECTNMLMQQENKNFEINMNIPPKIQESQDAETLLPSQCPLKHDADVLKDNTIVEDIEKTCNVMENVEINTSGQETFDIDRTNNLEHLTKEEGTETLSEEFIDIKEGNVTKDDSIETLTKGVINTTDENCVCKTIESEIAFEQNVSELCMPMAKINKTFNMTLEQVDLKSNEMINKSDEIDHHENISHIHINDKENEILQNSNLNNDKTIEINCNTELVDDVLSNVITNATFNMSIVREDKIENEQTNEKTYAKESVTVCTSVIDNQNIPNVTVNSSYDSTCQKEENEGTVYECDNKIDAVNINLESKLLDSSNHNNPVVNETRESNLNVQNVSLTNSKIDDHIIFNADSNATFNTGIDQEDISERKEIEVKTGKCDLLRNVLNISSQENELLNRNNRISVGITETGEGTLNSQEGNCINLPIDQISSDKTSNTTFNMGIDQEDITENKEIEQSRGQCDFKTDVLNVYPQENEILNSNNHDGVVVNKTVEGTLNLEKEKVINLDIDQINSDKACNATFNVDINREDNTENKEIEEFGGQCDFRTDVLNVENEILSNNIRVGAVVNETGESTLNSQKETIINVHIDQINFNKTSNATFNMSIDQEDITENKEIKEIRGQSNFKTDGFNVCPQENEILNTNNCDSVAVNETREGTLNSQKGTIINVHIDQINSNKTSNATFNMSIDQADITENKEIEESRGQCNFKTDVLNVCPQENEILNTNNCDSVAVNETREGTLNSQKGTIINVHIDQINSNKTSTFNMSIDQEDITENKEIEESRGQCSFKTDVLNVCPQENEISGDGALNLQKENVVNLYIDQINSDKTCDATFNMGINQEDITENKENEEGRSQCDFKTDVLNVYPQENEILNSNNGDGVVVNETGESILNSQKENVINLQNDQINSNKTSNATFNMSIDQGGITENKEIEESGGECDIKTNILNICPQENEMLNINNCDSVVVNETREGILNPQEENVNISNIDQINCNKTSQATFKIDTYKQDMNENKVIVEKNDELELEVDKTGECAIKNQNETVSDSKVNDCAILNATYIAANQEEEKMFSNQMNQMHIKSEKNTEPVFLPERSSSRSENEFQKPEVVDEKVLLDTTDCEIENDQIKKVAKLMDTSLRTSKVLFQNGNDKGEPKSLNEKSGNNIELGDCLTMEIKTQESPPLSPVISSKGYNFNFDEIDDPFATKTRIRSSPSLEDCTEMSEKGITKAKSENVTKKDFQRRKSVPVKRQVKSVKGQNKINLIFSEAVDSMTTTKEMKTEIVIDNATSDNLQVCEKFPSSVPEKSNVETTELPPCKVEETHHIDGVTNNENDAKSEVLCKQIETSCHEAKITSNSSNSTILDVDKREAKNVFNLPEMSTDMNFSPFVTKSKVCRTPSPILEPCSHTFKVPANYNEPSSQSANPQDNVISDDTKLNVGNKADYDSSVASSSSKGTEDATVREVNTEDEDTLEGPFFEADELNDDDKMSDIVADTDDMMNFNDMLPQGTDDNVDNGEMFIDAEAFEFLLNQNKSNMVVDSGKESLFLKFDPLFAKRMSSDGVLAALNKVQKRQSTPKRASKAPTFDLTYCDKTSNRTINFNATTEVNNTLENTFEDPNTSISKPMMVVNPAVSSIISPRNKPVASPPRANRRSLTFTSPAMAVIDRLLSLSGNNSTLNNETPTSQFRMERNDTDLTQLRELLAEKEIHVNNLRMESKELLGRLSTLETQVKSLESESEQRLRKVNELNERLVEKTKINKSMAAVVEEYERTIASLIAETEQDKKRHAEERMRLVKERDEQTAHLASMEYSFNDLHSKYEKSKQIILACKANEDTYKKSIKEFEESLLKMQNNYELLKQHATSKLNQANQELERLNRAHNAEVVKLNAMIKRKDLEITSLEDTLAQKTKANEELTAICDELINKVG